MKSIQVWTIIIIIINILLLLLYFIDFSSEDNILNTFKTPVIKKV
jgi:uncharacterized membrane protein YvbJ